MRRLTSLAALAMASVGLAQSPLTTLTGTGSGNVGGGIFFDLQIHTTVTITQIDFRCGANTVPGIGTLPFAIPNVASLDGLLVLMQGACLTSGFNPQGVVSSNQIRATVGSL